MIDRQKFNSEFVDDFGKETVIEVIDMFINQYVEHVRIMRKGLEEKKFKDLQGETHKIKPVLGYFHDPVSIEQSQWLDEIAKIAKNNWESFDSDEKTKIESDLEKAIEKFDKCIIGLLEELKKIKKELS